MTIEIKISGIQKINKAPRNQHGERGKITQELYSL